ncbi:hypothetical protein HMPREF1588_01137 [Escherichia coli 110957]|nr:hypothetical protein HMPREF1588_01137 [Escherichia coli 110957]
MRLKYSVLLLADLSPLARGTPAWRDKAMCLARFIPAGAGNTRGNRRGFSRKAIYPRWRGEHR